MCTTPLRPQPALTRVKSWPLLGTKGPQKHPPRFASQRHRLGSGTDFFSEFYDVEANKGNLWTPTVGDGVPAELRVPNLLAIPNMLVNLLRNQGSAVTPHEILASIDDFVQESGQPGHHWEYVRKWCLVAGQANANGKSKVCLDTTPVTVDDEDFNRWVGTRLDIAFGPRPPTAVGQSTDNGLSQIVPDAVNYHRDKHDAV